MSDCTPCTSVSLVVDPANESLASALNNFILNFYGAITKTVVNNQVVWVLPCNLTAAIPGYPRDPALGTACYFQSLFTTFGVQISSAQAAALAAQASAANALATANAASLTAAGAQTSANSALAQLAALGTMSAQNSNAVSITGGTITGAAVKGLPAPTSGGDAVTKTYADSLSGGILPKTAVRLATTANITLSAPQTIDGVSAIAGDRILVKNQSTTSQNGIYVVAAGAWSRAADANTAGTNAVNQYYFVTSGTVNAGSGWFVQTAPAVLDTNPLLYSQFSAATTYTAGSGLTLIGSQFALDTSIAMLRANNLSDVASVATARTNLGVTATGADTNYVFRANNLSDLASPASARVNLGVTATGADTTYAFRTNNLSDLANPATARTNLGVTATGADATYAFRSNNLSDLTNPATARTNLGVTATGSDLAYNARANNLSDVANVATARTNLGVSASGADPAYLLKSNNLLALTDYIASKQNLRVFPTTLVSVLDYGADPTGVSDCTTPFNNAIAALGQPGYVSAILINSYVGGFGTPSNSWTGRPSITLGGGCSAASGFQAYGNVNTDGYLAAIEITNPGSGYNVYSYLCARVNGSPTITIASGTFSTEIVAGTAVRFESTGQTCYVLTRNSSTSLTLSENMTFSNTDQFVFGLPYVVVNGTPNYDGFTAILGGVRTLLIPPGSYKFAGAVPSISGQSNLVIEATGADFIITPNTGSTGLTVRNSTGVTVNGGRFIFTGARYQTPNSAFRSVRYPGQVGFSISSSQYVTVNKTETVDAFMFGFAVSAGGATTNWKSQHIVLNDVRAINPLGDGIHISGGSLNVRVNRAFVLTPGDDALAVVNDGSPAVRPTDVQFDSCYVDGGTYRGCVAVGADYVQFKNIYGRRTHGPFLWAAADGSVSAPSFVTFSGIVAERLGDTTMSVRDTNSAVGIYATTMTGLTVRSLKFTQDSTITSYVPAAWATATAYVFGNFVVQGGIVYACTSAHTSGTFATDLAANKWTIAFPVYNVQETTITLFDSDSQKITSTGGTGTYTASINTDLDCQGANGFASVTLPCGRWLLTGSIAARSSTGSGCIIWPVFYDGLYEYGGGAAFQTSDLGLRNSLNVGAVIDVINQGGGSSSKTVRIKLKQNGSGGVTIDAGSTSGPNSYIQAVRLQ